MKQRLSRFRFVLSTQWLGYFLLAAAISALCIFLGTWQLDRRAEVAQNNARIESNYDREPTELSSEFNPFTSFAPDNQWLPMTLVGSYHVDQMRLVRNRPMQGRPGFLQVVPFHTTDGQLIAISRGWLPPNPQDTGKPQAIAPIPDSAVVGPLEVVVRVRPSEPEVPWGASEGQLASINLPAFKTELGEPLATGAYGQLASESGPYQDSLPAQQSKPTVDEGPHLSYALQWFAFSVLSFVALGYGAVAQARNIEFLNSQHGQGQPRHGAVLIPPTKRNSKRNSAEDEEDALLDAQGYF